jgi:hypothetical protein
MKPNTLKEGAAIAYFLHVVANIEPGTLVGPHEVEAIQAAAERIQRQIKAASKASRARSRKSGGRPRDENPSETALAWRKRREAK